MEALVDIFGIEIVNKELFTSALTHPSFLQENLTSDYTKCYERLEFLGDAVLKLAVSEILYNTLPEAKEGEMSKIRSIIVSDNILAEIAKKNGLDKLIILGKHDEKQGLRKINSVCACAFEAVLGAYYLEGKYEQLKLYIEKHFHDYVVEVQNNFVKFNAKAILQEYTQDKTKKPPKYILLEESGPAHKRLFKIGVEFEGKIISVEDGTSKKETEQKCAYSACKKLGIIE